MILCYDRGTNQWDKIHIRGMKQTEQAKILAVQHISSFKLFLLHFCVDFIMLTVNLLADIRSRQIERFTNLDPAFI